MAQGYHQAWLECGLVGVEDVVVQVVHACLVRRGVSVFVVRFIRSFLRYSDILVFGERAMSALRTGERGVR